MKTPTLMIRVESSLDSIPVDVYLRVMRDVCFVASEVGRALNNEGSADEALPNELPANWESPQSIGKNWRIEGSECRTALQGVPAFTPSTRAPLSTAGASRSTAALIIAPPPGQSHIAAVLHDGIRAIHLGVPERPTGFSDAALRSLRRVSLMSGRRFYVTISAGYGDGEAVALDAAVALHIDMWLAGRLDAMGSIDGTLEIISIHNRPRFTVYGRGAQRVECLFPEAMLPEVKSALGERVAIRGRIRYRRDGKPATMDARCLRLLHT
jgi:hypothetical protein